MRVIDLVTVSDAVRALLLECAFRAGPDLKAKIKEALDKEESALGKDVLSQIINNHEIAENEEIPLCQDTGQVVVFLEVGGEVVFKGDIEAAVNDGVRRAYAEGYLRKSVVGCPILRENTGDNAPAIIHAKITNGDKLKITVVPKGGGAENMSAVKMLTPPPARKEFSISFLRRSETPEEKPARPLSSASALAGIWKKRRFWQKKHCSATFTIVPRFRRSAPLRKRFSRRLTRPGSARWATAGALPPWR